MRKISIILPVLFLSLFLPFHVSAETMYVKSPNTKIKKDISPSSKTVAVLKKGAHLDIMEKKGKFYKVKLEDGKEGWVFKFKVTNKTPRKTNAGLFANLSNQRSISAKEASTGSSIRGLSKISKNYANDRGIQQEHIEAVKKMELFRVSDDEIDKFLQEGKLGEYGVYE